MQTDGSDYRSIKGYGDSDYYPADHLESNVLIMPDMMGRILQVVGHLDHFVEALPDETEEDGLYLTFPHLYYKDGYLYFIAEYNVWSREDCIGWRDGYRRALTQQYRLKLGEEKAQKAELLYSY